MDIRDEKALRDLIRSITEQVLGQMQHPEKAESGAIALVPSPVPDPGPMRRYLAQKYEGRVVCAGEGAAALGAGPVCEEINADDQSGRLMALLKDCEQVALLNPPLWMLKNIAAGDDRGYYEQAFLRALLWEKNAEVILDFDKPKFRRGTFYEGIHDALSAIEAMGAKVVSVKLSVGKPEGELPLVTEAEVTEAQKQGRSNIKCAKGAIVTPLARDTAKELGISIEE